MDKKTLGIKFGNNDMDKSAFINKKGRRLSSKNL